jgi:hypothetical protein
MRFVGAVEILLADPVDCDHQSHHAISVAGVPRKVRFGLFFAEQRNGDDILHPGRPFVFEGRIHLAVEKRLLAVVYFLGQPTLKNHGRLLIQIDQTRSGGDHPLLRVVYCLFEQYRDALYEDDLRQTVAGHLQEVGVRLGNLHVRAEPVEEHQFFVGLCQFRADFHYLLFGFCLGLELLGRQPEHFGEMFGVGPRRIGIAQINQRRRNGLGIFVADGGRLQHNGQNPVRIAEAPHHYAVFTVAIVGAVLVQHLSGPLR